MVLHQRFKQRSLRKDLPNCVGLLTSPDIRHSGSNPIGQTCLGNQLMRLLGDAVFQTWGATWVATWVAVDSWLSLGACPSRDAVLHRATHIKLHDSRDQGLNAKSICNYQDLHQQVLSEEKFQGAPKDRSTACYRNSCLGRLGNVGDCSTNKL